MAKPLVAELSTKIVLPVPRASHVVLPCRAAVVDGTLIPIDRIAADRPFYSGCDDLCVLPRAAA
jgi:hypothetical protein